MKLLKNNKAVSHVVGYALTIGIMAFLSSSTALMTFNLLDEKITDASEIFAENIANKVTDAVLNCYYIKDQYPNLNYSKVIDIPLKLAENRDYYIEVDDRNVYVNTTDGKVNVKNTIFNVTKKLAVDIDSERVYGSYGKINITCNAFDYVYKIDFGPLTSPGATGYARINNKYEWEGIPSMPDDWKYVIPINITNPTKETIVDYQILIRLNESNFDYSLSNSDGSDLRFYGDNGQLHFWIETWYSRDTHSSRIWVKLPTLPKDGEMIYMFFGNPSSGPLSDCSYYGGKETFVSFDDFEDDQLDYNRWTDFYGNDLSRIIIKNSNLVLSNNAALKSKTSLSHLSKNYVIETKVRSTEENVSAYIFAGSDGSPPPYNTGRVFSSAGLSDGNNLTLIENSTGTWNNITSGNKPAMKKDIWYRLSYTINEGDVLIARYYYNNFSLDSYDSVSTPVFDGYFGPCAIKKSGITYYDWIMVRKYAANTSSDVSSLKEAVPTARVGGLESVIIKWADNSDLLDSGRNGFHKLLGDYICSYSYQRSTFYIDLEDNSEYSLVINIGDGDISTFIDNFLITIKDDDNEGIIKEFNVSTNLYEKIWLSGITSDVHKGGLKIEFKDDDYSNCYWAVNSLTLEKGKRCIKIKGGS